MSERGQRLREGRQGWRPEWSGATGRSTRSGFAEALALTALVTVAGLVLFERGSIANVALLFLLPVMVAAMRHGLATGIVTSLVCALAYNFFFIPPTHTFTIENPQNIVTVLVLLGVAIATSQMASRLRAQALIAEAKSAQNSLLAGFAGTLTGIRDLDDFGRVLCDELAKLLDCRTMLLTPQDGMLRALASAPPGAIPETLELTAARWTLEHGRAAGRGTDTMSAAEWVFLPLAVAGEVLGVFGVAHPDAGVPLDPGQDRLLASLLDQAGLALQRIIAETEIIALSQVRERDRLRQALLSSVSHDLRTPLTTLLGTLQAIRPADGDQSRQLATACIEAERLNRFVGNLLDMARIEAGALPAATEPVDLGEAVASALDDLAGALGKARVRVAIATDLPFVLVDPQLLHHCLINLVDNAAKHGAADAGIEIAASRNGGDVVLAVMDSGPGLPPGSEERVFETFAQLEGSDRIGGSGLGLAIVRGFAGAMGLTVSARNREDGPGACFAIRFPASCLREWSET